MQNEEALRQAKKKEANVSVHVPIMNFNYNFKIQYVTLFNTDCNKQHISHKSKLVKTI